jgi:hypothetical protein
MTAAKNIRRTKERTFVPHHMLLLAARRARDSATSTSGYFDGALTAMTLSALAFEAMCNSIGFRELPTDEYAIFEWTSPIDKLALLTDRLGVRMDPQAEPWSSARWLIGFRNDIAHAKPVDIKFERMMNEREHENTTFDRPESELEKEITVGNAKRAIRTVETILDLLVDRMEPERTLGLRVEGWGGSSKYIPPTTV